MVLVFVLVFVLVLILDLDLVLVFGLALGLSDRAREGEQGIAAMVLQFHLFFVVVNVK